MKATAAGGNNIVTFTIIIINHLELINIDIKLTIINKISELLTIFKYF